MRILFFGCLHLGDGSRADDSTNEFKFFKWKDKINPDVVYGGGDLYELWQFKMKKIKKAHPKLYNFLQSIKDNCIIGNHDYKIIGKNKIVLEFNGIRILFIHLHQSDEGMKNPFIRLFVWFLAIPENLGLKNIDNPELCYFTQKQYEKAVKSAEKYARKELAKYDIVIGVHTHIRLIKVYGHRATYGNCGTCTNGKVEGLLYDTDTGILSEV